MKTLVISLVCISISVGLIGCASQDAAGDEQMLSAAGFRMKLGSTPAQMAQLQKMPQYKVIPHERAGSMVYVYADAKQNRLYVGDAKAYQSYEKMLTKADYAAEEAMDIQSQQIANDEALGPYLTWDDWGVW